METQEQKQRRGARSNQKLKILYLAKILLENTDANHDITLQEIIHKLSANNVTAERKSLYDDIAQLDDFGIKIRKTQYGKTYHYQVINRDFELAELKLLVDSVASAKFITEEKSNELIKKIEHLASKQDAAMLQRQVYVAGRVKAMNRDIMENVDAIHNAIAQNSKISFQYFQWNVKKEPELKKDGARYVISPWGLSWDDENYYLVGYDSDAGMIKHYRVDKMLHIKVENISREGRYKFKELDMAAYAKKMFHMFSGEEQNVEILCENRLAGVMIDRFGKDIRMLKADEEHFRIVVKVAASMHFIHWIMALGDGAKIIGPENLVEEVRGEINRLTAQYSK
ncbi:WYL domain-containing protein [Roseburia sp. MUC/MUC-530-WT-4D]|uniref:WYL domain-containing protein n=1 Tax=Roseburia porci TaxID=2605790 RepID=A0A6L5YT75_9FIRM|nr:WYL domain-containing protein [Roseburia porci]MST75660.1 WYL domain-containing protein [Roseburia porci]